MKIAGTIVALMLIAAVGTLGWTISHPATRIVTHTVVRTVPAKAKVIIRWKTRTVTRTVTAPAAPSPAPTAAYIVGSQAPGMPAGVSARWPRPARSSGTV